MGAPLSAVVVVLLVFFVSLALAPQAAIAGLIGFLIILGAVLVFGSGGAAWMRWKKTAPVAPEQNSSPAKEAATGPSKVSDSESALTPKSTTGYVDLEAPPPPNAMQQPAHAMQGG